MQKIHYVYKHTFANGRVYFGKGKNNRAHDFERRNAVYGELLESLGNPIVEIVEKGLSEAEAYQLEYELIVAARAREEEILNRTDGLERSPLGTMPWRSLIFFDRPITDKKYLRMLHIYRPPGIYSICITVVEAAIRLQCTCDEVLMFLETPAIPPKPDHFFLSDDDLYQRLPTERDSIDSCIQRYKELHG